MTAIKITMESKMISYKDICDKYNTMVDKSFENKRFLAHQITRLVTKLEEDLGLSGQTWKGDFDKNNKYIDLLDISDTSQPEVTNANSLQYSYIGSDPSCTFGIRFVLEKSPNTYPKGMFYIKTKAAIVNDKAIISVNHGDSFIDFEVDTTNDNGFNEIINDLKQVMINSF